MSTEQDRLLETLSRPWQDNAELQLLASRGFQTVLDASGAGPEDLATAREALERADRNGPLRKWIFRAVYLLAVICSLCAIGHLGVRYVTLVRAWHELGFAQVMSDAFGWPRFYLPESLKTGSYESPLTGRLSKKDALFLMGDQEGWFTGNGRWKTLWESEPDNPAYLVRYASRTSRLPGDFLALASRIDPDNGWFPFRAAVFPEDLVSRCPVSTAEKKAGKPDEYRITNAAAFQNSLSLLHTAAGKPRFETYTDAVRRRTASLLPVRHDLVSGFFRLALAASSDDNSCLVMQKSWKIISAEAQRCARDHDPEGLKKLFADWRWLARTIPPDPGLVQGLVYRATLKTTVPHLRAAATALDLREETRELSDLETRLTEYSTALKEPTKDKTEQEAVERKYGVFIGLPICQTGKSVLTPPTITRADFQPLRYATYGLLMELCSASSLLVFWMTCGVFALHRFRHGKLTRFLSMRLAILMRMQDWAWVIGGGMIAPLAYYLVITRLTPWSVRDQSQDAGSFVSQAIFQQIAALLLIILTSLVIARWRLSTRCTIVNKCSGSKWVGPLCAAATALALPFLGITSLTSFSENIPYVKDGALTLCAASLLPGMIWLLAGSAWALLGHKRHALRRATLARILVPVWALGALIMALFESVYYAEECHWVSKDRLFEITPDAYPTKYEYEVASILRREYLSVLNGLGPTQQDAHLNDHK